jgi:hypothetical protein
MAPEETSPDSSTSNPLLMQEIPQTLAQLNAKVKELFHCVNGPPVAYFEIPLDPRVHKDCCRFERYFYVSLVWRTDVAREGAEARLVMAMLEPFVDARRQLVGDQDNSEVLKPLLFWRRPLELTESTDEQDRPQLKLRCRVIIPGANLNAYDHKEGEIIKHL